MISVITHSGHHKTELQHCMQFPLSVNIQWGSSLARSIMAWL